MKLSTRPRKYARNDELWVLTVFYNPCKWKSRRETYETFIKSMRESKINILTIECAFGDEDFVLPPSHDVIKIRSNTLLWQKERLLNLGASYLPDSCKYVAWVDCDIIFNNLNWANDTAKLLETKAPVVQLFETCVRLEHGNVIGTNRVRSFASVTSEDQSTIYQGKYEAHGHTGYAWAARREIFDEVGLYEYAITGSADYFMSHAIFNHYDNGIKTVLRSDEAQIDHLREWGEKFYQLARGKIAAVPGEIFHLWHGTLDRRGYFKRMWQITESGYHPGLDLVALPGKPLEWRDHVHREKPALVSFFATYFESRQEDLK